MFSLDRSLQKLLCLLALGCALQAPAKTVRVLTIGNSFSRDAVQFLREVTAAAGHKIIVGQAMIGGCDFERHMRHVNAFEANREDPEGRPYQAKAKSLFDMLAEDKWDYVTIQQVSHKSFKPETFQPFADQLVAYVRKHAPQAEIVIHQTWAYRDDHPFWNIEGFNTDVMYKGLRAAYDQLASEKGLRIIPSGDAMQTARQDPAWGKFIPDPGFDYKKPEYPNLPTGERRSLHMGCKWGKDAKTGKHHFGGDRFHANEQGQYLLGCVWFEFFFGDSVVGNTFVPGNTSAEDAAILQKIAHKVVSGKHRPE
ncbi:MAG: DUF4886 domain-containing protein [Kiritimatiellae bacterium]|nr:DUF4886 domain-containing protein [Kiritimatiellia bacterium]